MDIADLRFFDCVARVGNMNRAAVELNTVQSNVTTRIRNLEHDLGVVLFHRHSRGVAVTAAGEVLLPYARQVMTLLADARKAVTQDGAPEGPLNLGALETVLALHLAPVLSEFAGAHPAVDLSIQTGTSRELVEMVLAHGVEGALVCGPVAHPDLEATPVFREDLCIVARRDGRSLGQVLGAPGVRQLVLRLGCSYRQRLEDVLARRGVVGVRTLEFGTLDAIRAGVAAGVGITLMPRRLVTRVWGEAGLALHPLEPGEAEVTTDFIRRKSAYVSPAQRAILEALTRDPPIRMAG
ncbi:LysR family transcriptional regulator [Ruegeria pomeroyi]|nr:LysR family transcriptional regulator [Ruegeria pomeroyi]